MVERLCSNFIQDLLGMRIICIRSPYTLHLYLPYWTLPRWIFFQLYVSAFVRIPYASFRHYVASQKYQYIVRSNVRLIAVSQL